MALKEEPKTFIAKLRGEIKDSHLRFKDEKLLDKLLWIGILLISEFFAIQFFGWLGGLAALFLIPISVIYFNMQPQGFLIVFSIIIAAKGLYLQNDALNFQLEQNKSYKQSIDEQINQFVLDKRPYLFINFARDVVLIPRQKDMLCGVAMNFQNAGQLPATIINTTHKVFDDTGKDENFPGWFQDTYGGFPQLKVVPPKNILAPPIASMPGVSLTANYVCIYVVVSYRGPEAKSNSIYWTKQMQVWQLIRKDDGTLDNPKLVDLETDWDENENKSVPVVTQPNWEKYKK